MADDTESLLAQAQAIQAQKMGQMNDSNDLLKQAQAIQNAKLQVLSQEPTEPSISQTAMDQGLQGVTAGFSDELAGLGSAGMQAATGDFGPEQGRSWEDIKAAYTQMRDSQRKKLEEESKAHPVISMGANIAGGIVPAIATGGTNLAGAAGLGAATGLGTSQQDLVNQGLEAVPGALKDTAIGTGLGAAGYGVGKLVGGALNPENLEIAGSKMASSAVGLKPAKELTRQFSKETGKSIEGANIIRDIGKTAMDEGAFPITGGANNIYDKSLDAINNQYTKLNPILDATQDILSANTEQALEASGHIGDKAANFIYEFQDGLSANPNKAAIMKKIEDKYFPYVQELSSADGDLRQLTKFKTSLQKEASNLSKAAYDQPASDLKPEAEFVKRLGGIVRQHIEDVASAADPGAGQQISGINKTLGNLYTYRDAAKTLMNKPAISIGGKDIGAAGLGFLAGGPIGAGVTEAAKLGLEAATGNPLGRLGKIAAAKALNSTSKAISTPAGQLVQKTAVAAPLAAIESPFTNKKLQSQPADSKATKLSGSLYNATDDSLKEVASSLAKTPGLQFYAEHLNKAIDTDDQGEKNRAIFLIMQNPKSRRLVSPEGK